MLRSGAETARVEETVGILVKAFGLKNGQALVMPTGLYLTVEDPQPARYPLTVVRRVRQRSIHYQRLADVNDLSRRVARGLVVLDEAERELYKIEHAPNPYPFWLWVCAGAGSAAGATVLLGGGPLDVVPAFFSTVLVQLLIWLLAQSRIPALFGDFFGATLATVIALGLARAGLPINLTMVVAGGILKLVPGGALTASVQDGISGDLLSSAARGLEALLKGAALASGVGLALNLGLQFNLTRNLNFDDKISGEVWQIPIQVAAAFCASACYAVAGYIPRFAIATAGLGGACGWLVYLLLVRSGESVLLATFAAAFVVGWLAWTFARLQHAPITIYIIPAILPLLPGLTIYQGMLSLARNQNIEGLLQLVQANFLGGALAAGVALSTSLALALPHFKRRKG